MQECGGPASTLFVMLGRTSIVRRGRVPWLAAIVLLSGCAGGGGGGGGQPNVPVVQPFTSWSAVQPNSKVTAQGMSQTTAATFTVDINGDVTIASISPFSAVDTNASSATLTFGASRQLTGLQINAPVGSVSWDTADCGSGVCTASKDLGASEALTIDPYSELWNYQSFGVWQTGTATGGTFSGTFGAISFGAPTPVGGLPSSGTLDYTGLTAGVYVNATGQLFGTSANMSATVDFGPARSVTFSTTGTVLSTASGAQTNRPELDMMGTLSFNGSPQFTGTVNTDPSFPSFNLSGTATGRFYGPAAQEIGGVYELTGAGQSMGGGFGGKR